MLHIDEPVPCNVKPPPLWFSEKPEDIALAKALCLTCPQRLRCLEETLETEEALGMRLHGIHGGLDPAQRTKTQMKRLA